MTNRRLAVLDGALHHPRPGRGRGRDRVPPARGWIATPAHDERDTAKPACVAIDGKTLRGSFDASNDRKAAHVLSAFASDD